MSNSNSVKVTVRPMEGEGDLRIYADILARSLLASYVAFMIPKPDLQTWIDESLPLEKLVLMNPYLF